MSFTDYVTSLRISEAKHLLQTTALTMGDIAKQTGFNDQSYFTKVFKAKLGITPTEFRQKDENRGRGRTGTDQEE
jgi:two-component system response regulator YesN